MMEPSGIHLASVIEQPSYLSLEKALEYHDLIPEGVPVYTSVTTKRPGRYKTPMGTFDYRHLQRSLFWGYDPVRAGGGTAYVASPEKALLDLIYLSPVSVTQDYLEGLRLQNLERLNVKKLLTAAKRFAKPKLMRAAREIKRFVLYQKKAEKVL